MTYNMHVQKHSILTIHSGLSLSRYDVQHACIETLDTDNIFGPLSRYDVQHACTETLDTDNIFGPLSLVMTYNMHEQKQSIVTIYSGLSLSLIMTCNMHVQKHSILTIHSGLSVSLSPSRYDVQNACTETLYTDNIFEPLSLSLVMTHKMHVQRQSILTISAGLSLSRHDVQHACTETLITENIYGPLSLSSSLSRYDAQNACTETLDTDKLYGPLSPSLTRYDVQHECTEIFDTDNIFGHLSLSLSLWRTTCMYRNTRYWQHNRAPLPLSLVMTYNMHDQKHSILTIYSGLSLSLVMTYNMHVQKHSILTIYSGLPLSRYDVQHACTETLETDNIFGPPSLPFSLS